MLVCCSEYMLLHVLHVTFSYVPINTKLDRFYISHLWVCVLFDRLCWHTYFIRAKICVRHGLKSDSPSWSPGSATRLLTVPGRSAEGAKGDQWPAVTCQQVMCPPDCTCQEGLPFPDLCKGPIWMSGCSGSGHPRLLQRSAGNSWRARILFIFTSPAFTTVLDNNRHE